MPLTPTDHPVQMVDEILAQIESTKTAGELKTVCNTARKMGLLTTTETAQKIYPALIFAAFELKDQHQCHLYYNEAYQKKVKVLDENTLTKMFKIFAYYKNSLKLLYLYHFMKENNLATPEIHLRAIYAFIAAGDIKNALTIYYNNNDVAVSLEPATATPKTHNVHISMLYLLLREPQKKELPPYLNIAQRAYDRLLASNTSFNREEIDTLMEKIKAVHTAQIILTPQSKPVTRTLSLSTKQSSYQGSLFPPPANTQSLPPLITRAEKYPPIVIKR